MRQVHGGLPHGPAMDMKPNQVIRAVQLGLKDMVLDSNAIWYCAGCETCASRCPRDIDMARVNKSLARMCVVEGRKPKDPAVAGLPQVIHGVRWAAGAARTRSRS